MGVATVLVLPLTTRVGLVDRLRVLVHGEVRNTVRVYGIPEGTQVRVGCSAHVPRLREPAPVPALGAGEGPEAAGAGSAREGG